MSDSKLLLLLPSRQSGVSSSTGFDAGAGTTGTNRQPVSRASNPDDGFKQKLAKAKMSKASAGAKPQQAAATPVKASAPAVSKPAASAVQSPNQPAAETKPAPQPQSETGTDAEATPGKNSATASGAPLPVEGQGDTVAGKTPQTKADAKTDAKAGQPQTQTQTQTQPQPQPTQVTTATAAVPKQPVVASSQTSQAAAASAQSTPKNAAAQPAVKSRPAVVDESVSSTTSASVATAGDVNGAAAVDPGSNGSSDPASAAASQSSSSNAMYGTGRVVTQGIGARSGAAADVAPGDDTGASSIGSEADAVSSADAATGDPVAPSATGAAVKPELAPVPGAINGLPGMDGPTTGGNTAPIAGRGASATVVPPQARFVAENQPKIVTAIHGQLLPNGGTMQLRLNPPELGAVQVTVHMRDGVMSAAFETTSDHATRLLSHSLGDLKSGLEANGVSVEKLHVQQAPKRDADTESDGDSKQQPHEQQQQAQQDQQRREVVRRMWRKLAGDEDPLDMVA